MADIFISASLDSAAFLGPRHFPIFGYKLTQASTPLTPDGPLPPFSVKANALLAQATDLGVSRTELPLAPPPLAEQICWQCPWAPPLWCWRICSSSAVRPDGPATCSPSFRLTQPRDPTKHKPVGAVLSRALGSLPRSQVKAQFFNDDALPTVVPSYRKLGGSNCTNLSSYSSRVPSGSPMAKIEVLEGSCSFWGLFPCPFPLEAPALLGYGHITRTSAPTSHLGL